MSTKFSFGKLFVILVAFTFAAAISRAQQNVDDEDVFEMDGNPQDGAPAGEDWHTYFPSGPGGNALATVFVAEGLDNVTIFTQGGSKDIYGIQSGPWRHTNGSVPDKDNLENAFAAGYNVNNELILYFGADRRANNGDANIGFWFFQSEIGTNPDGTFSGQHMDGDIFVVSGFTSGGQTSEIDVYQWVGDDATGHLQLITSSTAAQCASSPSGSHIACAISNTGDVLSGWTYTPKSGTAGTFPVASFFEGGINVTALLGGATPCFSSFMVETRSSTSESAQLKDFALGNFDLCSIQMTKDCFNGRLSADGTSLLYDVTGTVTNTGVLTLYDVTVTDNFPGQAPRIYAVGTLAGGAVANWPVGGPDTFDSGTTNGPTNSASVTAAGSPGGPVILTASASDACPVVPINPALTVTKGCTTDLTEENNRVSVEVSYSGQVCNTGNVPLNNVTVEDDKGSGVINLGTLDASGGANDCKPYSGSYFPSIKGSPVANGRYHFTDQVTATGTPSIGDCAPGDPGTNDCVQTAGATCPLCDFNQCAAESDF